MSGGGYEPSTVVVGSGQVVKMRTKEGMSPTKVLDRKATIYSDGRHFSVDNGGELVVMELTLTGGYAVSVVCLARGGVCRFHVVIGERP